MIARLLVATPFTLSVPEGLKFNVYEFSHGDYRVRFFPPEMESSSIDKHKQRGLDIRIDGAKTIQCDLIHVDFLRADFDRKAGPHCDPPLTVIKEVLDFYVLRLRYVTKAAHIHSLDFPNTSWKISYLNDDESEPPKICGLVRGRGGVAFSMSCVAITAKIWDDIHKLPENYEPQPWESLLLEATAPGLAVGNAVVLAATALEVFISYVLDGLQKRSETPKEIWDWVNNRSDWRKEPSVEEQFDVLLKIFSGHSLKEESM